MHYKHLGRTGLKVSEACLGTNMFGRANYEESRAMVEAAVAHGINFIDTADIYSNGVSEEYLGRAIKDRNLSRTSLILATKVRGKMGDLPNDEGLSRKRLIDGLEDSLRRLQTDYIDLYQMHWFDERTPLEETLRTLDDLVTQGKIRYIGVSNFEAWRLMKALWVSAVNGFVRFECLQQHYSLINRDPEKEIYPACLDQGLAVITYSPTGGGFLTGKYQRGAPMPPNTRGARNPDAFQRRFTDANWATLDHLQALAQEKGCRPHHLALAWCATHPAVTAPIVGCSNAEQLVDNLKYLEVKLSDEERKKLSGD
jgi:aryl-alcohol dehydrogenase-like predicted oxidoreductase